MCFAKYFSVITINSVSKSVCKSTRNFHEHSGLVWIRTLRHAIHNPSLYLYLYEGQQEPYQKGLYIKTSRKVAGIVFVSKIQSKLLTAL